MADVELMQLIGAIGADNKTFYIAESKGYGFGTIISDDEIEMSYLEQGKPAIASIDKFHRRVSI